MTKEQYERLTYMQRRCLTAKADGLEDVDAARMAGTSRRSLQTILCRLRGKFQCASNGELIAQFAAAGGAGK